MLEGALQALYELTGPAQVFTSVLSQGFLFRSSFVSSVYLIVDRSTSVHFYLIF